MNNCISKSTKILLRIAPLTFTMVLLFSRRNDGTEGAMYDLSGRLLKSFRSGIHIIRYSDGTVKKVYTK